MPDYFSLAITAAHIVAVTDEVMIETSNPDVTKVVKRGVYSFTSYKTARHFKTIINATTENATAFLFTQSNGDENVE